MTTPNLKVIYLSSKATVNDRVFLGIVADSLGLMIDGIDIFLSVSNRLQVVDYIPTQLMPIRPGQFTKGTSAGGTTTSVSFSQLCNGGEPLLVKGLIAVIECKAISKGYANVAFDFTLGSTRDTNIAAGGKDILTKVTNCRVTII